MWQQQNQYQTISNASHPQCRTEQGMPANFNQLQNQKHKFDCPICGLQYDIDVNCIILSCYHKVCKDCYSMYVTTLVDQGKFNTEDLVCFVCSEPLEKVPWDPNMTNFEILKQGLSKEYVEKIERLRIGNMKGVIYCPNPDKCECRIMTEDINNGTCPVCSYEFCCTCLKKPHNDMCNLDEVLEQAKNMGMDVRKCPSCNTWMTKDDKCMHVTCFNCKVE